MLRIREFRGSIIFCLLVKEFSGIINFFTGYKLMITEKSLTNKQYIYIYIVNTAI